MSVTRAEQRRLTRRAIVEAATAIAMNEGIGAVTTRRAAHDVGVSQSTVMYHFSTREKLLAEAVTDLAGQIERATRAHLEQALGTGPVSLEAFLDVTWSQFRTPQALAAAQLWIAAWTEPAYVETVRALELRIQATSAEFALPLLHLFPDESAALAFMDTALSVIRGLVVSVPVWGLDALEVRWQASRATLLAGFSH